jgi:putative copper export protein
VDWVAVAVHWLHVLFAVTWFGGHIARVLLVEPAVRTLPDASQAAFNRYVEKYATRLYVPVIIGVGVTGVLRGTVFGPVKSVDALLGTPYGLTFLGAIGLGIFLAMPTKPQWMDRLHVDWVAFLVVFTAMILMHFGL